MKLLPAWGGGRRLTAAVDINKNLDTLYIYICIVEWIVFKGCLMYINLYSFLVLIVCLFVGLYLY